MRSKVGVLSALAVAISIILAPLAWGVSPGDTILVTSGTVAASQAPFGSFDVSQCAAIRLAVSKIFGAPSCVLQIILIDNISGAHLINATYHLGDAGSYLLNPLVATSVGIILELNAASANNPSCSATHVSYALYCTSTDPTCRPN